MNSAVPSRSFEGGLCAILAGMLGQWVGFIAFRLFQLFRDWLGSTLFSHPRAFSSVPAEFILLPPSGAWVVLVIAGSVIALVAYWIFTMPVEAGARQRRRLVFNIVVVGLVVLMGRATNFVSDLGVLLMALDDIVQMSTALWVIWRVIEWTSVLIARLRT